MLFDGCFSEGGGPVGAPKTDWKSPWKMTVGRKCSFFPKQCGNTWGSYGSSKRPGCLDRGAGEVLDGIHRYFRGFVLACSFRLWIFVVSGVAAPTPAGFVCKFSLFPALQLLRCSFFVVILVLFVYLRCSWKGLKRVSSVNFRAFSALQLLPCSFFVVILVLFGVLQCSWPVFLQQNSGFFDVFGAATSGPRTDIHFSW